MAISYQACDKIGEKIQEGAEHSYDLFVLVALSYDQSERLLASLKRFSA